MCSPLLPYLSTREECINMLATAEQYDRAYRPLCDLSVVNEDLQDAVSQILAFVQRVSWRSVVGVEKRKGKLRCRENFINLVLSFFQLRSCANSHNGCPRPGLCNATAAWVLTFNLFCFLRAQCANFFL